MPGCLPRTAFAGVDRSVRRGEAWVRCESKSPKLPTLPCPMPNQSTTVSGLIVLITFLLPSTDVQATETVEVNRNNYDDVHKVKEFVAKRYNAMLRKTVRRAKAAETLAQQRLILSKKLRSIAQGLERAKDAPILSQEDQVALDSYLKKVQAKHNRLNGLNGVSPVPASDLDSFSDSIQQDLELGDTLTILAYIGLFVLGIVLAVLISFAPVLL